MEIIYLLIPLSLILLVVALAAFRWATKSGQFDDLDSPALSILDDDPGCQSHNNSELSVDRAATESRALK